MKRIEEIQKLDVDEMERFLCDIIECETCKLEGLCGFGRHPMKDWLEADGFVCEDYER